jgi:hypothetical protein
MGIKKLPGIRKIQVGLPENNLATPAFLLIFKQMQFYGT